jgi:hypothetical protein
LDFSLSSTNLYGGEGRGEEAILKKPLSLSLSPQARGEGMEIGVTDRPFQKLRRPMGKSLSRIIPLPHIPLPLSRLVHSQFGGGSAALRLSFSALR